MKYQVWLFYLGKFLTLQDVSITTAVTTLISSVSEEQDILAKNQRNPTRLEFCSEIFRRPSRGVGNFY